MRGASEKFAMEVILKEDINKLGHAGDVVKVADGYGRNYLLPQRLAIEANVANKAVIEQMKSAALRRSAKSKDGAADLGTQLETAELTFERKVGAGDHLFGSVTTSDIAHALEAQGFKVDRRKIALDEPLKSLGEFHVPIKLHREVTSHLKVTIKSDDPNYVPGQKQQVEEEERIAGSYDMDQHHYTELE